MKRRLGATLACALVVAGCGSSDSEGAGGAVGGGTIDDRVERWLSQMTLEQKVAQMHGASIAPAAGLYLTPDDDVLGIPGFKMVDGPRGVRAGKATTFPVGMARAATWNPELEGRVGEAMGQETAAKGGNVLLAPTVNNLRHPRWGRAQETYGEDVHLLGEMGSAFVTGAQKHVLTSLKHFAANTIEDTRFTVDVTIDERTLREIYLRHFEKVVKTAHPGTVMSAYNSVDGHFCSENSHLLHDVLRGDWGFDGIVVSDWVFGTHSTVGAALAGLDIEMPLGAYFGEAKLIPAVEGGQVPMSAIDDAVRRILRTKLAFSLDAPAEVSADVVESKEHTDLTLETEREAIVLLKNAAGALPIDRAKAKSIAVVGVLADTQNLGDQGSSNAEPSWAVTPLAGIEDRAGAGLTVSHFAGPTLSATDLAAVTAADAAVVVVGLTAKDEGENSSGLGVGGDRKSLDLAQDQQDLVLAVAAANPRTIVVIEAGSAVTVAPFLDPIAALLVAWYPGQEGGHAIADVLFGDVSPSGRLPVTFPVSEAQLPPFVNDKDAVTYDYFHGYRFLDKNGDDPSFPFGFGLGYTTFAFANLKLAEPTLKKDGVVHATVDVTNTGAVAGKATVELYASYEGSAVPRAVRDLEGFSKVLLAPGETKSVAIDVPVSQLAYWDVQASAWVVEPISYTFAAGASSRDLPQTAKLTVTD